MRKCVFHVIILMMTPCFALAESPKAWSDFKAPVGKTSEAIGRYNLGCLMGGAELPVKGRGFESIRRHRNRYYGHQRLIGFLRDYGERITKASLQPVLIGDLSQPRGGRMSSGHRSHQIGLDADVWFTRPRRGARGSDRSFPSMVDLKNERIDRKHWNEDKAKLLKLAAEDSRVARVFVHWVIKQEVCRVATGDRAWLAKIRPWWGHSSHFHIRLGCASTDQACVDQQPVKPADGCGEERWFSRASVARRARQKGKPPRQGPAKKKPSLHPRCHHLLVTGRAPE
ncbi:MAG: penicillin-insensitive murein endopeptidase [Myxococcota bacterium]|nr:penicillin-insensitive murein endopeptidase [Myxococcota bacterium]